MGKYKRIFYIFSIVISLFLIKIDVFAEGMSLTYITINSRNPSMSYKFGSQTGSNSEYTTVNYGNYYLKFFDNIVSDSSALLSPSYYTLELDFTNYQYQYVSFTTIVRDAQLTNVNINNGTGNCIVTTGNTFNEDISNFISYNVTCANVKINSENLQFIFHISPIPNAGVNIYILRRFTLGTYNSFETNSLLETANQKQQQMINTQTQTNTKLDENKQAVNQNTAAVNKQTDTMKDSNSSEATDEAGSFFSGFESDTFGLTSIITAPLNLIQSVTSSTCSTMGIPVPFVENTTLELPCLRGIYERHFGSFLDIYQTITFGIVAYWVCVRIFALVKDFKNPDHDEIEVMDL